MTFNPSWTISKERAILLVSYGQIGADRTMSGPRRLTHQRENTAEMWTLFMTILKRREPQTLEELLRLLPAYESLLESRVRPAIRWLELWCIDAEAVSAEELELVGAIRGWQERWNLSGPAPFWAALSLIDNWTDSSAHAKLPKAIPPNTLIYPGNCIKRRT